MRLILGCVLGVLLYLGPAAAQTMVEYGAAGSAAATGAAASKGVGNSIGGMIGALDKALNQAQDQSPKAEPSTTVHVAAPAPAKPAPPRNYEDAAGIRKDMSCEEVIRRFGPPSMSFATEDNARTMSYVSKTGGVQAECQGGKVTSVEKSH